VLSQVEPTPRIRALLEADKPATMIVRHEADSDFYTEHPPVLLADDPAAPTLFISQRGAEIAIAGRPEAYGRAFADLLAGRVEREGGWPDAYLQQQWEAAGRRALHLTASPIAAWDAALQVGFNADPESFPYVSYRWYFEGAPRFAAQVKHPCRLSAGQELYELLLSGIPYDSEGAYTRRLLECRPSFVCELPGPGGRAIPVCWAAQHADHAMGMIFTPPEYRRQGYAVSLAAFMTDYVLEREGFAAGHIAHDNEGSMGVVKHMGATRWDTPITWRAIRYP
jgi:hypothetical protein